jgi:RNA polymerase sigma-70 factor (ECF subfamily)
VAEGTIKSRCARGRARMALTLGHLRPGAPQSQGRQDGSQGLRDDSHGNPGASGRVPLGSAAPSEGRDRP